MEQPAHKLFNLELELKSTDWINEKVISNKIYAQNLYAALCNNEFVKNSVWPVLKDERWSCTWRYAGGIIADIRKEGDYLDWYCTGIRGSHDMGGPGNEPIEGYVGEGYITDEIKSDLFKLGWIILPE